MIEYKRFGATVACAVSIKASPVMFPIRRGANVSFGSEFRKGAELRMSRKLIKYRLAAVFLCLSAWGWAEEGDAKDVGFEVALTLENGHLAQVILGVSPKASDHFDRECDSPAPPPGHGTGYTAFLLENPKMFLYRDIRPPAERIAWTFLGRVHPDKPIRIRWQSDALPEGYDLKLRRPEKDTPLDMRKTNEITLEKTEKIEIVGTLKNQAEPAGDAVKP